MSLKNPTHPGVIVREECLGALGLTVTEGAKILGVSRKALSDIVNKRAGISAEMAIRLSKAFGGTAAIWMRLQAAYDLAQAEKRAGSIKVRAISRRKLAA
jgi:addiction module HigA family antidote